MKKYTVYLMTLFAIAGVIAPANSLRGAGEQEEKVRADGIEADPQIQQLRTRAGEVIQRSPAWVALSLAQKRNRLLDDIESLTILNAKYLIDIEFFDKQIKIQQGYQDFLSELQSNYDLIGSYLVKSYDMKRLYSDQAEVMRKELSQLKKRIRFLEETDLRRRELYELKFRESQEGIILEQTQAAPYVPPSSWRDRLYAFFSGKRDPADMQTEVNALEKKLARITRDSERAAATALKKMQEIVDRKINIKNALKVIVYKLSDKQVENLRKVHLWVEEAMAQMENMHQLSLEIYHRKRELERVPTTY